MAEERRREDRQEERRERQEAQESEQTETETTEQQPPQDAEPAPIDPRTPSRVRQEATQEERRRRRSVGGGLTVGDVQERLARQNDFLSQTDARDVVTSPEQVTVENGQIQLTDPARRRLLTEQIESQLGTDEELSPADISFSTGENGLTGSLTDTASRNLAVERFTERAQQRPGVTAEEARSLINGEDVTFTDNGARLDRSVRENLLLEQLNASIENATVTRGDVTFTETESGLNISLTPAARERLAAENVRESVGEQFGVTPQPTPNEIVSETVAAADETAAEEGVPTEQLRERADDQLDTRLRDQEGPLTRSELDDLVSTETVTVGDDGQANLTEDARRQLAVEQLRPEIAGVTGVTESEAQQLVTPENIRLTDSGPELARSAREQLMLERLNAQVGGFQLSRDDVTFSQTEDGGLDVSLTDQARERLGVNSLEEALQDSSRGSPFRPQPGVSSATIDEIVSPETVTIGEDGSVQLTESGQRQLLTERLDAQIQEADISREDVTFSQGEDGQTSVSLTDSTRKQLAVDDIRSSLAERTNLSIDQLSGIVTPANLTVTESGQVQLTEAGRRQLLTEQFDQQYPSVDITTSDVTFEEAEQGLTASLTTAARAEVARATFGNDDLQQFRDSLRQRDLFQNSDLAPSDIVQNADDIQVTTEDGQVQYVLAEEPRRDLLFQQLRQSIAQTPGVESTEPEFDRIIGSRDDVSFVRTEDGGLRARLDQRSRKLLIMEQLETQLPSGQNLNFANVSFERNEEGNIVGGFVSNAPSIDTEPLPTNVVETTLGESDVATPVAGIEEQLPGQQILPERGEVVATAVGSIEGQLPGIQNVTVSNEVLLDTGVGADPTANANQQLPGMQLTADPTLDTVATPVSGIEGQLPGDQAGGEIDAPDARAAITQVGGVQLDRLPSELLEADVSQHERAVQSANDAVGGTTTASGTSVGAVIDQVTNTVEQLVQPAPDARPVVSADEATGGTTSDGVNLAENVAEEIGATLQALREQDRQRPAVGLAGDATAGVTTAEGEPVIELSPNRGEAFGDVAINIGGATVEDQLETASEAYSETTEPLIDTIARFSPVSLAGRALQVARGRRDPDQFLAEENEPIQEIFVEEFTQGTASLLNLPQTAIGLKEGAEFVGQGAFETATGDFEQFAGRAGRAADVAIDRAVTSFERNPVRTSARLTGSLVGSAGIMGLASRAGRTSGVASRFAIQPGEEILTVGANRALRNVPGGSRVLSRFPNNRLDNEEIVIRETRRGIARARRGLAELRREAITDTNLETFLRANRAQGDMTFGTPEAETESDFPDEIAGVDPEPESVQGQTSFRPEFDREADVSRFEPVQRRRQRVRDPNDTALPDTVDRGRDLAFERTVETERETVEQPAVTTETGRGFPAEATDFQDVQATVDNLTGLDDRFTGGDVGGTLTRDRGGESILDRVDSVVSVDDGETQGGTVEETILQDVFARQRQAQRSTPLEATTEVPRSEREEIVEPTVGREQSAQVAAEQVQQPAIDVGPLENVVGATGVEPATDVDAEGMVDNFTGLESRARTRVGTEARQELDEELATEQELEARQEIGTEVESESETEAESELEFEFIESESDFRRRFVEEEEEDPFRFDLYGDEWTNPVATATEALDSFLPEDIVADRDRA